MLGSGSATPTCMLLLLGVPQRWVFMRLASGNPSLLRSFVCLILPNICHRHSHGQTLCIDSEADKAVRSHLEPPIADFYESEPRATVRWQRKVENR